MTRIHLASKKNRESFVIKLFGSTASPSKVLHLKIQLIKMSFQALNEMMKRKKQLILKLARGCLDRREYSKHSLPSKYFKTCVIFQVD